MGTGEGGESATGEFFAVSIHSFDFYFNPLGEI
jgi:hypothetical protein